MIPTPGTLDSMATVEQRLSQVEADQQADRNVIRAELRGLGLGVQLVRSDVQEVSTKMDAGQDETRARLIGLNERLVVVESDLGEVKADVAEIKSTLAEVLRRLPEPPA